ncbi:MAG: DNA repair protein RecO [Gammaproteobacteria bacterium]
MSMYDRVQLEPAFLLHGYNYRDSSRLLEFFTKEHGRLTAIAKGARRARSKFKAVLQPFNVLLISWSGGELPILTSAEPHGNQIRLDGKALYSGFYMNELVLRLTAKRDPHPEIFGLLDQALHDLNTHGSNIALRLFEKGLLEALGYGLNLELEGNSGKAVVSDGWYQYHVEHGPLPVEGPNNGAIRGSSLVALARGELDLPEVQRDAKRILRLALDLQLGGRPLQTRRVVSEMKV